MRGNALLASAGLLLAACATHPPTATGTTAPAVGQVEREGGNTTEVTVSDYGELQLRGAQPKADGSPAWLAALHEGDELRYVITDALGDSHQLTMRVERVVRRGQGVAALLKPQEEFAGAPKPRWIAGDGHGLYQLAVHGALVDPELVPLDEHGKVLDTSTPAALWMLPSRWARPDQGTDSGWKIEELDLAIEGTIEGDRCAQMESSGENAARWTICESVGVVAREPIASHGDRSGTWRLQRVVSADSNEARPEQAAQLAQ